LSFRPVETLKARRGNDRIIYHSTFFDRSVIVTVRCPALTSKEGIRRERTSLGNKGRLVRQEPPRRTAASLLASTTTAERYRKWVNDAIKPQTPMMIESDEDTLKHQHNGESWGNYQTYQASPNISSPYYVFIVLLYVSQAVG